MTPERAEVAADRLRALDLEAEQGWPGGFDMKAVAKESADCLETVVSFLAGVPDGLRPAVARSLAGRILGR